MKSRKDSRNSVNIMESPFVFSRTETWSATVARRPQCGKTVAKTTTKVYLLERWHQDDVYRTNQSTLYGWTIEYVKYFDCFGNEDISSTAPKSQRTLSQGMLKVIALFQITVADPRVRDPLLGGSGDGEDFEQKRVESARSTGFRPGMYVRYARPDNQGTLNMVEQELGEPFSKRPRTRHLHRLGQDSRHGGIGAIDTTGKNGKNNPGRNKNGMSENEIRWSEKLPATVSAIRPSETVSFNFLVTVLLRVACFYSFAFDEGCEQDIPPHAHNFLSAPCTPFRTHPTPINPLPSSPPVSGVGSAWQPGTQISLAHSAGKLRTNGVTTPSLAVTTPFGTSSTTLPATAAPWLQSRRNAASCHPAPLMTVTFSFHPDPPDPSGRDLCRPADIWVPHGRSGQPEAWDFSICSARFPSIWSRADWDSGTVFQHVESRKSLFHNTAARCASSEVVGPAASASLSCRRARESRRSSTLPSANPSSLSLSASQQPSTGKTRGRSSSVLLMISLPTAPVSAFRSLPRISPR